MKVFVVHRSSESKYANRTLLSATASKGIGAHFFFLNSSFGAEWKDRASREIESSELVLVFRTKGADISDNMAWELEEATRQKKRIIEFEDGANNIDCLNALKSTYAFSDEFEGCFSQGDVDQFSKDTNLLFENYRLMVETSEALVQRRLITNTFFFGAVSAITAACGYLAVEGYLADERAFVLAILFVLNTLVCNSWQNLLRNYGNLNAAKFRVINRLEKEIGVQLFNAEWIALGKGVRPKLYKSFTATEQAVPKYFLIASVGGALITLTVALFNATQHAEFFGQSDWPICSSARCEYVAEE